MEKDLFPMKFPLIVLASVQFLLVLFLLVNMFHQTGYQLESHFDPMFSIAPVAFGLIGILLACGCTRRKVIKLKNYQYPWVVYKKQPTRNFILMRYIFSLLRK
jgi:hypothetical protein